MYTVRRRGMGAADPPAVDPGVFNLGPSEIAHCASSWYYFDPFCWATGYNRSAFQTMGQFNPTGLTTTPVAPAAIASGLSTEPAPLTQAEYDQQTSDVLNAAMLATQAANLAKSQSQPVVCEPGQTLADDGITCLSPSGCSLLGIPCWGAALAAVGAVLLVTQFSARRRR